MGEKSVQPGMLLLCGRHCNHLSTKLPQTCIYSLLKLFFAINLTVKSLWDETELEILLVLRLSRLTKTSACTFT